MKLRVQLFTKKYCGICEDVLYKLKNIQKDTPFLLETIDIEKNNLVKYTFDIPVIHVNGKFIMKHGLDLKSFKEALTREQRIIDQEE